MFNPKIPSRQWHNEYAYEIWNWNSKTKFRSGKNAMYRWADMGGNHAIYRQGESSIPQQYQWAGI